MKLILDWNFRNSIFSETKALINARVAWPRLAGHPVFATALETSVYAISWNISQIRGSNWMPSREIHFNRAIPPSFRDRFAKIAAAFCCSRRRIVSHFCYPLPSDADPRQTVKQRFSRTFTRYWIPTRRQNVVTLFPLVRCRYWIAKVCFSRSVDSVNRWIEERFCEEASGVSDELQWK